MSAPRLAGWMTTDAGFAGRIGEVLRLNGVRHCAWKGDPRVERFERGEGDLDLLVDRSQVVALAAALAPLGFRPAVEPSTVANPGLASFFAPHPEHGTFLHVHAHFRLLVGGAGSARYHLPVERDVLESRRTHRGLQVPPAAFSLVLLVLHETLRHRLRDLRRAPSWLDRAERTRNAIERATNATEVAEVLAKHFPQLTRETFAQCRAALDPDAAPSARLRAAIALKLELRGHRAPSFAAVAQRLVRRTLYAVAGVPMPVVARPVAGGAVIALVGADGSGKSTCAVALARWLGGAFAVAHLHLGRPPRGPLTLVVGALLKAVRTMNALLRRHGTRVLADHLELARTVCTARDRRRLRAKAGRLAAAGAIVICERMPTETDDPLAGTSVGQGVALTANSRYADWLRAYERRCYQAIVPADLTIVLRLAPHLAVLRKPEEPSDYVHRRARRIFDASWDRPGFKVVDASRPLDEVLRDLRTHVWQAL